MKVTQVALRPTEESERLGRPGLTPELLAATGARYSRSNEGLEAILGRIDPNNLDKSVDSIFRMIDYGHQSIADMAPVALFIDGVSLYLAYAIWALCPTASGQESSTRYIDYGAGHRLSAQELGIAAPLRDEWERQVDRCLAAYTAALHEWHEVAASDPEAVRIPAGVLNDPSDKAARQAARMKRNYAFDRARYFLPLCGATNLMMVMSARGWVQLCQSLLCQPLPEAQTVGHAIAAELKLAAPRLLKHAVAQECGQQAVARECERLVQHARNRPSTYLGEGAAQFECPSQPYLEVHLPAGVGADEIAADMQYHPHRYAPVGDSIKRTAVRFGWEAITIAEIRDLNRHRTGNKYCPLVPQGFYAALDQWPQGRALPTALQSAAETGRAASARALQLLQGGDPASIYWTVLGTQFPFEHVTTADKFLYEAELRTGTGAHYRYAGHLRDVLALWYRQFPATRGLVLEGSAEPE